MNDCVECGAPYARQPDGSFLHVRDPHDPAATADHDVVAKGTQVAVTEEAA